MVFKINHKRLTKNNKIEKIKNYRRLLDGMPVINQ
jgi:hypothetical protein